MRNSSAMMRWTILLGIALIGFVIGTIIVFQALFIAFVVPRGGWI